MTKYVIRVSDEIDAKRDLRAIKYIIAQELGVSGSGSQYIDQLRGRLQQLISEYESKTEKLERVKIDLAESRDYVDRCQNVLPDEFVHLGVLHGIQVMGVEIVKLRTSIKCGRITDGQIRIILNEIGRTIDYDLSCSGEEIERWRNIFRQAIGTCEEEQITKLQEENDRLTKKVSFLGGQLQLSAEDMKAVLIEKVKSKPSIEGWQLAGTSELDMIVERALEEMVGGHNKPPLTKERIAKWRDALRLIRDHAQDMNEARLEYQEQIVALNGQLDRWKTAASSTFGYEESPTSLEQKMIRVRDELFKLRGEVEVRGSEVYKLQYKLNERTKVCEEIQAENTKLKAQPAAKPEPWIAPIQETMTTPWPMHEILAELVRAADHLLDWHNCDTHGWEGIDCARDAGRSLLAALGVECPAALHPGRKVKDPAGVRGSQCLGQLEHILDNDPERLLELADRMAMPGPKAEHLSASECLELADGIRQLVHAWTKKGAPAKLETEEAEHCDKMKTIMNVAAALPADIFHVSDDMASAVHSLVRDRNDLKAENAKLKAKVEFLGNQLQLSAEDMKAAMVGTRFATNPAHVSTTYFETDTCTPNVKVDMLSTDTPPVTFAKSEPVADAEISQVLEEMRETISFCRGNGNARITASKIQPWRDTLQAVGADLVAACESLEQCKMALPEYLRGGSVILGISALIRARKEAEKERAESATTQEELNRWRMAALVRLIETPKDLAGYLQQQAIENVDARERIVELEIELARCRESAAEDRRDREKLAVDMGMVEGESLDVACRLVKMERDVAAKELAAAKLTEKEAEQKANKGWLRAIKIERDRSDDHAQLAKTTRERDATKRELERLQELFVELQQVKQGFEGELADMRQQRDRAYAELDGHRKESWFQRHNQERINHLETLRKLNKLDKECDEARELLQEYRDALKEVRDDRDSAWSALPDEWRRLGGKLSSRVRDLVKSRESAVTLMATIETERADLVTAKLDEMYKRWDANTTTLNCRIQALENDIYEIKNTIPTGYKTDSVVSSIKLMVDMLTHYECIRSMVGRAWAEMPDGVEGDLADCIRDMRKATEERK